MANALLRICGYFTAALVGRLGGVAAGIGVALPLDALLGHLFSAAEARERERARQFCHCLADELAVIGPKDEGTREAVCSTIEAAVQRTGLTHRRLVELNLDPDAAMREVAAKLDFASRMDRTELEPHCHSLIRTFYDKLPRHAHILAEMLPDLWAVVLRRQAEQDRKLDKIIEQNNRQLELLEQEKGIPHAALIAHLERLGADPAIEPADVPAFLERFAAGYVETRERLTRPSNADPSLAAAREEAMALLDVGDLAGARQVFRRALDQRAELRRHHDIEEASLLADAARLELLDLRYRDAATFLAEAADLTAFDPETSWQHRLAQASAFYRHGSESGDNAALAEAIAIYDTALALAPRATRPDDWALTQNELGNALALLGELESDPATLIRAVAALEAALEERSQKRVPLEWACTQSNLADALRALGELTKDAAALNRAVATLRQVLLVWTRAEVPLGWAAAQHNLGGALLALDELDHKAAHLHSAAEAFRQALLERTRERVPLDWGRTQSNLGEALRRLGKRNSSSKPLGEAVIAFEQALLELTRDRVPRDWARIQNNLGSTLTILGQRDRCPLTLGRSVEAFKQALLERTRERNPLGWARTQHNLGQALLLQGMLTRDVVLLQQAIEAYKLALEERTRGRVPLQWATTQTDLGSALLVLGFRENGTATLEQAVRAHEAALEERTRERVPFEWAQTQENLAIARLEIGRRRFDAHELGAALAAVDSALQEYRASKAAFYIEKAERLRGEIVAALGESGG